MKPYLCRALDSAINQTYKNLEIIIIDDGSTDGSERVCDIYQKRDKRIRLIHQENRGLSSARNAGLEIMKGEIVAFLDPDDAFLPQMIESLVRCMIKSKSDIVACGFYIFYSTKECRISHCDSVYNLEEGCYTAKEALNLLEDDKISVGVWSKIYKKELFDGLRFADGFVFEDVIITPYLLEKAHKVSALNQPLILHWRYRPNSITATMSEKNMLDCLHAMQIKERFIIEHTQFVYGYHKSERIKNQILCDVIGRYCALIAVSEKLSESTKRFCIDEITSMANRINMFTIKSKILYSFYKANPKVYARIKSRVHKIKVNSRHIRWLLKHLGNNRR